TVAVSLEIDASKIVTVLIEASNRGSGSAPVFGFHDCANAPTTTIPASKAKSFFMRRRWREGWPPKSRSIAAAVHSQTKGRRVMTRDGLQRHDRRNDFRLRSGWPIGGPPETAFRRRPVHAASFAAMEAGQERSPRSIRSIWLAE